MVQSPFHLTGFKQNISNSINFPPKFLYFSLKNLSSNFSLEVTSSVTSDVINNMKKIQIFIQIITILASTSAIENVIKICNEEKSILSWLHFIQNVEVETFYLNKVSNGLLKSTIETFHLNLDQLKYPKEFEIKEIFILQNDSKIFHGNSLRMNLVNEATFQPKLQSTIQIHLSSNNFKIQIISLSSFICTNGNLCGLVKQYGRISRDLLCHKIDQGKLAFIGKHTPSSGNFTTETLILPYRIFRC